jgi:pyridoxal phosphate enzyme (YggS family)
MNLCYYKTLLQTIPSGIKLVVVSKMQPVERIQELYNTKHRVFGENRPQEMKTKYEMLPKDVEWHFIGHLQTNKVKYIAPFVSLIQSIDSFSLLQEVNRQAQKNNRIIPCLLQFFIAQETTKFGFYWEECKEMLESSVFKTLKNIIISGVMGMATFTENQVIVREEFKKLNGFFHQLREQYFSNHPDFKDISMGMSDDYPIALEEGATIVRIGSAIFRS